MGGKSANMQFALSGRASILLCYIYSLLSGKENLDDQCRDPMNNDKESRVGQLTRAGRQMECLLQNGKYKISQVFFALAEILLVQKRTSRYKH